MSADIVSDPNPVDPESAVALPKLSRDPAFLGATLTQFLGAFNDNLYKALLLFVCVEAAARAKGGGDFYQPLATFMFALPFVLFSGYAGFLSDRFSKRTIMVLCKVGEILVMLAGLFAFLSGQLLPLFVVMFLMSTQSAFFGPGKYGILPEMLRHRDLPAANGLIQLTTFLAIIFGVIAAGSFHERLAGELWIAGLVCVCIAVLGTGTSLLIRKTPVARPGLPFSIDVLGITREMRDLLRSDRLLFGVLLASSLFWFLGSLVQMILFALGDQMQLEDTGTALLFVSTSIGIGVGCAIAGFLSKKRVNFGFVRFGAWGIFGSFAALTLLGANWSGFAGMDRDTTEWIIRATLLVQGVFCGFFIVPLQVCLQSRPPKDLKGRMIGTMNLINWIAIILSAPFYLGCRKAIRWMVADVDPLPISWSFVAAAVVILPVALFYRPADQELEA